MNKRCFINRSFLRVACLAGAFMLTVLAARTGISAENMDQEAGSILQQMSNYLGRTKRFSVNADIDFEIVRQNGQKLQLSSSATVVMARPAKFHITRKGMITDAEFIFDGTTLTLHGKNLNVYAQVEVPGTIDDAILAYEFETGLPAPGADLLFSDSYRVLSSGVVSSFYVGTTYVNGVECHHLAFREAKVDWQLWVQTGDTPLPMKYVITSKWHTSAPQYELRLRDWKTNPQIKDGRFDFVIPKDATRLETMTAGEFDELTSVEEDK
jgi:hypothetical protein